MLVLASLLIAVGASDAPLVEVDAAADDEECAPPQPGFLTLDTAPWTVVYVDGAYVGSTPLFRHPLVPGPHTLTLVNEGAGVLTHEDVVVEEGKSRKLKMLLASFDTTTALDNSSATDVNPEDCFLAADEAATLSIDSTPWSHVYVDGKRIGTTPIFRAPVTAGDHVVRLVRADGAQAFARFTATLGETIKLAVQLGRDPVDE